MKFKELGLSKPILKEIEKMGYNEATPIQELSIPHILNNEDIIGIAQTGTGKTAAFALPLLEKLMTCETDKKIKLLILSPTRELAIQIRDNIKLYLGDSKYKCSVILGGVNQDSQIRVLKNGIDILVATPGRLLDLVKRKYAVLDNVKYLVLDEADTMLDMGFIRDIRQIINKTPKTRQTLLFSATMPKEIKDLANEFLKNPKVVKVETKNITASKIKQTLYYVDKKNKLNLLLDIMKHEQMKSTLIFTRTKHGANKLSEQLLEFGVKASVIHGNKSQSNRVKALSDFKTGKTTFLIATDIAARGIDISELSHVINYDMPEHPELYVHRIGRTARAGLEGKSISICTSEERKKLHDIEKLIKEDIEVIEHDYKMMENNSEKTNRNSKPGIKSVNRNSKPGSKPDNRNYKKLHPKTTKNTKSNNRNDSKNSNYNRKSSNAKRYSKTKKVNK